MRQIIILAVILIPSIVEAQITYIDSGSKSFTTDQIGIGISDPGSYQLNVLGNSYLDGIQYFRILSYNGVTSATHLSFPVSTDRFSIEARQLQPDQMEVIFQTKDKTSGDFFKFRFDDYRGASYYTYPFMVSDNRVFLASDGGVVSIGTTTIPSGYLLAVEGKAIMEEVKVEGAPWSDYVFSDNYDLTPLEEMESFIKVNQRLSDMPSAEEVAEKGIALGEMNRLLLGKVAELTLHKLA